MSWPGGNFYPAGFLPENAVTKRRKRGRKHSKRSDSGAHCRAQDGWLLWNIETLGLPYLPLAVPRRSGHCTSLSPNKEKNKKNNVHHLLGMSVSIWNWIVLNLPLIQGNHSTVNCVRSGKWFTGILGVAKRMGEIRSHTCTTCSLNLSNLWQQNSATLLAESSSMSGWQFGHFTSHNSTTHATGSTLKEEATFSHQQRE